MAKNSLSKDLSGLNFGRWVVLSRAEKKDHGHVFYNCRCECGSLKTLRGSMLTSGASGSCGCLRNELTSSRSGTHRLTGSLTYRSWRSMRDRCLNKAHHNYPRYGGRGITICPEWDDFEAFLADMGERPSQEYTIDRIDVNRNYAPDNCRWADAKAQGLNRRDTKWLTYRGETLSTKDMAEKYGIPRTALTKRLARGWDVETAISKPVQEKKPNGAGRKRDQK